MIPEDSILRRHYLTEFKNKQQSTFEDFILQTRKSSTVESIEENVVQPFIWHPSVCFIAIAILFVVFLIF